MYYKSQQKVPLLFLKDMDFLPHLALASCLSVHPNSYTI